MHASAQASAEHSRPARASAHWLSNDHHSAAEMILLAETHRQDLERWRCGFASTHPEYSSWDTHLPDWARTRERVVKHEIYFARWAKAQHAQNPASSSPAKDAWYREGKNERISCEAYGTAEVLPDRNIPRAEPLLDWNVWDYQESLLRNATPGGTE